MDKRIITILLAAVFVLTLPFSALAAEKARVRSPQKKVVVEEELTKKNQSPMRLRNRQLALEERESELEFERQMRQLELMERKADIKGDWEDYGRKTYDGYHRLKWRAACGIFLGLSLALNILLAVWVYQDIRKRNAGSGLWIVIALISGFFGVLLYTIVRLGDIRQGQA